MVNTIKINDVEYVRKDDVSKEIAEDIEGMPCVLIRSYGAGVFYGFLKKKEDVAAGTNVIMNHCKRIHYWDGACSLTQVALDGVQAPQNCRITDPLDSHFIANVIEILPVSKKALKSMEGVKIWKK